MKRLSVALGCTLLLASLTGCAGGFNSTPSNESDAEATAVTDPREGWVVVRGYDSEVVVDGVYRDLSPLVKGCDGGTLIYMTTSYDNIAVITDSPECLPDPQ